MIDIMEQSSRSNNFRVLILEYVTATFGCSEYYNALLLEGFSMAYTLAKLLNKYVTAHILGSSFLGDVYRSEGDAIRWIDCKTFMDVLPDVAKGYDKVIVIAPPIELVRLAEILGERLWGPSPEYIKILSDKYSSMQILEKCGIEVPRTMEIRNIKDIDFGSIEYPVVIKPCMQAGSECVYMAESPNEAEEYAAKALLCDPLNRAVIQQYMRGTHSSISAILGNGKILFYSVNRQLIELKNGVFKYRGNVVPIRDISIVKNIYGLLTKFVKCYSNLEGYIGFDIVIDGGKPVVVEINPRLTTSFIAIAKLYPEIGSIIVKSLQNRDINDANLNLGDLTDKTAIITIYEKSVGETLLIFDETRFLYRGRELRISIK